MISLVFEFFFVFRFAAFFMRNTAFENSNISVSTQNKSSVS